MFEPLEIIGVIAGDIKPPYEATHTTSYSVPIRLSRSLSHHETETFTGLWESATASSPRHRRLRTFNDIATVIGTTIEEVATTHARTLRSVVDAFNIEMPLVLAKRADAAARAAYEEAEHRRHIADVAATIRFD